MGAQASREDAGLELRPCGLRWAWRSRGIVRSGLESLLELAHGLFEQLTNGRAGALTEVIEDRHFIRRQTAGWPLVTRRFAAICRHEYGLCAEAEIALAI